MYGRVIVCTCGAHEFELHAPMFCFVDRVGEDYYGGAAGGRPGEGHADTAYDEHLVEVLKVAIIRL